MIDVLVCCAILGYCIWMCRIDKAASATGLDRRAAPQAQPARRDAARPAHWPSTSWSALDERQLNRLLRDSAP
jgi:hypothetical protein